MDWIRTGSPLKASKSLQFIFRIFINIAQLNKEKCSSNLMGDKHQTLTEKELTAYSVNELVLSYLNSMLKSNRASDINVLDWGCGRGRSVIKLRELGFNAFGVDIDQNVMANGFSILRNLGYDPEELLRPVDQTDTFDDEFFHLIISDQVFEHVANLDFVLDQFARLTIANGAGIHCFPGSKNIYEGHLHMPLVHWLPKNALRKLWIGVLRKFSYGPKSDWIETEGMTHAQATEVYYQYANSKTFYRDNEDIQREFRKRGFTSEYEVTTTNSRISKFVPETLRRNGFPKGNVIFSVQKFQAQQGSSANSAKLISTT